MTAEEKELTQVALVQEQYYLRLVEQLIRADHFPQLVAVLKPVHPLILCKLFVETADRGEEDDRVAVVKEGEPCRALRPRAPNVVQTPFCSCSRACLEENPVFLNTKRAQT